MGAKSESLCSTCETLTGGENRPEACEPQSHAQLALYQGIRWTGSYVRESRRHVRREADTITRSWPGDAAVIVLPVFDGVDSMEIFSPSTTRTDRFLRQGHASVVHDLQKVAGIWLDRRTWHL